MHRRIGLLALGALGLACLAGCGGGGSNPAPFIPILPLPTPTPTPAPTPTLHQFAYVAAAGGIDVFAVSGAGAVSAPTLDPATTPLNVEGLAVAPSGAFLVAVDSLGKLDSFTINHTDGSLTAVTSGLSATDDANGAVLFTGAMRLDATDAFGVAVGQDPAPHINDEVEGFTIDSSTGAITAVGTPQTASAPVNSTITELSFGLNANNAEIAMEANTNGNVDAFPVTAGSANVGAANTTSLSGNPALPAAMQGTLGLFSDIDGGSQAIQFSSGNVATTVGNPVSVTEFVNSLSMAQIGHTVVGVYLNNQSNNNVIPVTTAAVTGEAFFNGANEVATVSGFPQGSTILVPPAASGARPLVLVLSNNTNTTLTALVLDVDSQDILAPVLSSGSFTAVDNTNAPAGLSATVVGTASFFF